MSKAVAVDTMPAVAQSKSPPVPYREGTTVQRFVHHATPDTCDLLRHVYTFENITMEVTENVAFVLIRLRPLAGKILKGNAEASAGSIAGLARRILNFSGQYMDASGQSHAYQLTFKYKPPLEEGSWFTTNHDALPVPGVLRSYVERVDGGLANGRLFFLGYKTQLSGDGRLIFLSDRHWFDGKCWEPYGRRRYPDKARSGADRK